MPRRSSAQPSTPIGRTYHWPMVTLAQLLTFALAAVLITATPGPDNLMVLGMGMSKGRKQGIAFGLGCATGCLSHTVLAVLGVSAVVAASPLAFAVLKWVGGGYLVWLGVMALRSAGKRPVVSDDSAAQASLLQLFVKGMVANAINPKVVLFFLSFLPQFVMPQHGSVAVQLGLLGVVFAAQAAVLFTMLAWFAGSIGGWLNRTPGAGAWLDRVAGAVFVALGIRMVASR
jgi:threonine/homoserine/homoserine lactone efflux protein